MRSIPRLRGLLTLPASLILVTACGASGGAGWSYAPLGPTPTPGPSGEPTGEPSGQPSGSPGLALETVTPQSNPLAFEPNVLEMPAATVVQVTYVNDSNLPHNINFFDGPDETAPSLGATEVVTGPGAPEAVSFTTPQEPGDYFFWCDVHGNTMVGTYRITE